MPRPQPVPSFITWLGKVLNGVLLLVCGAATVWATQLYLARRVLPYDAAGNYLSPRTGIRYSQDIVAVAGGLALLCGVLTLLLLVSAYRLYVTRLRRKTR
ncbi:hypothetical protein [Hymenobacter chitinivorans]|uniref:PepSY-associated transmembrane protein n=1 Tax=Hymenobacter chitinivorans DSM 11115 TaxID=1121954 RepID=A0A2M9AQQ8_9BACT|nr:hypothetical protein [Hymenobacter chitinivorans]PJJ48029.1 hypothetical protein CLV45_4722 [Hymenobacter chitinivorans DSM 11115]